ncbi:23S rRNA (guanosine(2251)-2'-O)-methyltransferase RlmB [Humitalea sp. 24SJ18S-53]|uniref:23S rRNA (guanosine(2251)-2'-O)-methyltransferase RlmB n=1 Tax=Humitalea sp. 24SJ18S-53 TaxID=3422307 RepID=UPI003D66C390
MPRPPSRPPSRRPGAGGHDADAPRAPRAPRPPTSEDRGRKPPFAGRERPEAAAAPFRAGRDDSRAPRRSFESRDEERRPAGPPRGAPMADRPPYRARSAQPAAEGERPPRAARPYNQDKPARTPRADERPRGGFAPRPADSDRPARSEARPSAPRPPRFDPTRTESPRAESQRPAFLRDARQGRLPRVTEADAAPIATPPNTYWLYGLHAVEAALRNTSRRGHRLLLTADAEATLTARLPPEALTRGRLTPERADRQRFQTFLTEDAVHQGAAMLVEPLTNSQLERVIAARPGPVVLLDQVTDPRNVGAILRSAAAFGAAAVVLQSRHAPPETGAMARAASGALDLVPIVREVNLARTIQSLQKLEFWVVGLAGTATRTMAEAGLGTRRIALVLGAEDAGLRRLQRETCDELLRLPMAEGVESLNVSAAAAVALYEVSRR